MIDDIISVVCEYYGVVPEAIRKKGKGPHYVQCARKAVCYYLKTLVRLPQRETGKLLSRDGSTVCYLANHFEPEPALDNRVRLKVYGWL